MSKKTDPNDAFDNGFGCGLTTALIVVYLSVALYFGCGLTTALVVVCLSVALYFACCLFHQSTAHEETPTAYSYHINPPQSVKRTCTRTYNIDDEQTTEVCKYD